MVFHFYMVKYLSAFLWFFDAIGAVIGNPTVLNVVNKVTAVDLVYISSIGGFIYVLDMASGHQVAFYNAESPLLSGPCSLLSSAQMGVIKIDNSTITDILYFGHKSGDLSAVRFTFVISFDSTSYSPSLNPTLAPTTFAPTASLDYVLDTVLPSKGSIMQLDSTLIVFLILFGAFVASLMYYNFRKRSIHKYSKVYIGDQEIEHDGETRRDLKMKPKSRMSSGIFLREDSRVHAYGADEDTLDDLDTEFANSIRKKPRDEALVYSSSIRKEKSSSRNLFSENRIDPHQDIYQMEAIRASTGAITPMKSPLKHSSEFFV
jgi:hypothetical protein